MCVIAFSSAVIFFKKCAHGLADIGSACIDLQKKFSLSS